MQSVAVLRPHPIVWRDPPVWPFLWRGLLPLLALILAVAFAVGPFAHAVEGTVRRELREQLTASGFSWVSIEVSGQDVTLTGEEPAAGAGARALQLAQAARCPTWSGSRICAARVVGHFSAPAPLGGTASASSTAARACDQGLAAALAGEQIEFATSSATIDGRSAPLLERLAQAARSCPATIRIEGHTDLIGRGEFNRSLSEARAKAVRDALIARGVAAERLQAQGFGARRPIADNTTDSGRARNRRIEFHAVSAD
jgi:outer membrane protein OmpA-like peptidoglycan-associated protein